MWPWPKKNNDDELSREWWVQFCKDIDYPNPPHDPRTIRYGDFMMFLAERLRYASKLIKELEDRK